MSTHAKAVQEIPLETWAAAKFGEHAPSIGTLRRWARDGKIYPTPRKIGRDWMVSPRADYVTNYSDIARVQRESATAQ